MKVSIMCSCNTFGTIVRRETWMQKCPIMNTSRALDITVTVTVLPEVRLTFHIDWNLCCLHVCHLAGTLLLLLPHRHHTLVSGLVWNHWEECVLCHLHACACIVLREAQRDWNIAPCGPFWMFSMFVSVKWTIVHTIANLAAVCRRFHHFISTVLPKNTTHKRFKC